MVGRTRYCVRPRPWVDSLAVVGGTKDPDPVAIATLRPDLLLVNDEENRPADFPALAAIAPLRRSFPRTVTSAIADLVALAEELGVPVAGAELAAAVAARRAAVLTRLAGRARRSVVCLIWRRPWRALGRDSYASDLLAELGCDNLLDGGADAGARYPEITPAQVRRLDPDLLLLPDEPFPFTLAHGAELGLPLDRLRGVDGQALFWHGARLEQAHARLAAQLHGPGAASPGD